MLKLWQACTALAAASLASFSAAALEPRQVFAKASTSVVVVHNITTANQEFQGSGVVLKRGYVATNCHVVKDALVVSVERASKLAEARVVVRDEFRDVCLLNVDLGSVVPATASVPSNVQSGTRVYAIGSPRGFELTISEGLVSGLRDSPRGTFIQTTAAISHGSSGGGLFDDTGSFIGLTTLSIVDGQNLNFAVPASAAYEALASAERAAAALERAQSPTGAANNEVAPPKPTFDSVQAQLAYYRWLGAMNVRLRAFESEPLRRVDLLQMVWYESTRAGLEPALVLAIIETASEFRRFKISTSGARGYMQLMPKWVSLTSDENTSNLFGPQTNVRVGCAILRHNIDQANGNVFAALKTYAVQVSGLNERPNASTGFANRVFAAQMRWK